MADFLYHHSQSLNPYYPSPPQSYTLSSAYNTFHQPPFHYSHLLPPVAGPQNSMMCLSSSQPFSYHPHHHLQLQQQQYQHPPNIPQHVNKFTHQVFDKRPVNKLFQQEDNQDKDGHTTAPVSTLVRTNAPLPELKLTSSSSTCHKEKRADNEKGDESEVADDCKDVDVVSEMSRVGDQSSISLGFQEYPSHNYDYGNERKYVSASNVFEFKRTEKEKFPSRTPIRTFSNPAPSKWDNVQKWIASPTESATEANLSRHDSAIEIASVRPPSPAKSVSMRDMGIEITPIVSQEPSRNETPIRATAPSRSRIPSVPTSVGRQTYASLMTNKELSEKELQMKTRREIMVLGNPWNNIISLVEKMKSDGIFLDAYTYNTLITCCKRGSLHKEAAQIFEEMKAAGFSHEKVESAMNIYEAKAYALDIEELYYSHDTCVIIEEALKEICEVRKKSDMSLCREYPILDHIFFCEHFRLCADAIDTCVAIGWLEEAHDSLDKMSTDYAMRDANEIFGVGDEFVTFAICVRVSQLVGIGLVKVYYPNQLGMQFGLVQDLHAIVIAHSHVFTKQEAWDDYNKTLNGIKLFSPSCIVTTSITTRYHDWWTKSVQEMARAACSTVLTALALLPSKSTLSTNQFLFSGKPKFVGVLTLQKRCFASKVSMSLKAGIVGLPNVGKSTLFNAVVENGKAQAANFPFCTIEPNVGIVAVPNSRLQVLSKLSGSQKMVPASIEFVDIAGLVIGASQGEGLGNKFLSHIREFDAILQVVRCFEDNDIIHVNGKVDPKSDIDVINLELIFCDLDQIGKRIERLKKGKAKDSQSKVKEEAEKSALERIQEALLEGKPARSVALSDLEQEVVKHLCLLTMKPMIYVANVAETDLAELEKNTYVEEVKGLSSDLQSGHVVVSAQVESALTELPLEPPISKMLIASMDLGCNDDINDDCYNSYG